MAAFLTLSTAPPGVARGQAPAGSGPPLFSIEEATVADLGAAMQAGRMSARQLVDMYLARIEGLDRRGPTLRQVLETNPDAPAIADQLDSERRTKGPRGPLHGIPILIKDNIDTADRMTTTAGSLALERFATGARRLHRRAAARGGRDHPRQDQHE